MKFLIDAHSPTYDNNRFFDLSDKNLNRDDGLTPFVRLKTSLENAGYEVCTFDIALKNPDVYQNAAYISFGRIRDFRLLQKMQVKPYAFIIMEPPLTNNRPYKILPELTQNFQNVFLHNTHGDGYSIKNVITSKLHRLFWPQPFDHVVEPYWSHKNRAKKVVIINGKHRQKSFSNKELYSKRIKWSLELNKFIPVDLFGRGWSELFSRNSLSFSYLLNFRALAPIYKGACESKFAVMSQYDFALCFENFIMDGYITEKIFDCFYSGVIPIYWGGDDITKWIPETCFIDRRRFANAEKLSQHLLNMSAEEKNK